MARDLISQREESRLSAEDRCHQSREASLHISHPQEKRFKTFVSVIELKKQQTAPQTLVVFFFFLFFSNTLIFFVAAATISCTESINPSVCQEKRNY